MYSDTLNGRSAGILLHITSLPSPYGVGTLGKAAYRFADFLARAGQRWWQVLPIGHTGCGDSPYQCFSAFAGNPYLIDLDLLADEGLISRQRAAAADWGANENSVDYGRLYLHRFALLREAAENGWQRDWKAVSIFCGENADWLPDYALFMALKRRFGGVQFQKWGEAGLVAREVPVLERYRMLLAEDIRVFIYAQFLFFRQWDAWKRYVNGRGISIIGDLPIYTAMDSSDVWAAPENYLLDEERRPCFVAGVPPDAFSRTGQLWGNPLYDWTEMERSGFSWWRRRMAMAARLFDCVRIDHFRGFVSGWAVPYGAQTAENGQWLPAPGEKLLSAMRAAAPGLAVIAEDLGVITDEVRALRDGAGLPGMKVLQFAFEAAGTSEYLPHRYPENSVCYTGTHDNPTLRQFLEEMPGADRAFLKSYLGGDTPERVIAAGLRSDARLFVAPLQDYLGLGAQARMNVPGTVGNNWRWRVPPSMLTAALAERVRTAAAAADR